MCVCVCICVCVCVYIHVYVYLKGIECDSKPFTRKKFSFIDIIDDINDGKCSQTAHNMISNSI